MSKKGFYAMCRTCLTDSFSYSNIFKELLKGEYVYEILKDVCQLEVNTDDGLPEYVCFDCHKKLSEFHSFKVLTHEGNAALHRIKDDRENVCIIPGKVESYDSAPVAAGSLEVCIIPGKVESYESVPVASDSLEGEIKCEVEDPLDVGEDESNARDGPDLRGEIKCEVEDPLDVGEDESNARDGPDLRGEIKCEVVDPLDVGEDESNARDGPDLRVPSSPGRISLEGHLIMLKGAEEENPEDRRLQMNVQGVGKGMRDICAQNSIFKGNESRGEVTKIQDWNKEIRIVSLTNLSGASELYFSGTERNENTVDGLSEEGELNASSSVVITPRDSVCEEPRPAEEYDYSEEIFVKPEPPVDRDVKEIADSEGELCEGKNEDVISKFSEAVSRKACGDLVDKEISEIIDSEGELCEVESEDVISKFSETASHKACGNFNACTSGDCSNLTSKEKCNSLVATSVKSEPLEENESGGPPSNDESSEPHNEEEYGVHLDLLVCDHCGEEFLDKTALLEHLVVHFEHGDIGCSSEETILLGRVQRGHRLKVRFKCRFCGKGFAFASKIRSHEIKHTGDKPFECKVCQKKFTRRINLRYHEYLHTGEKPFACQKCGKRYCDKRGLRNHERSHLNEKQFECESCDKKFNQLLHLKRHQKLHDKHRMRFRCNFCDKEFSCKRYLNGHVSIHLGEGRFKCGFCGKIFNTSSSLKTHERLHTRVFPVSCDICKKGFVTRTRLRIHQVIHSGERPYKCDQCLISYPLKGSLQRHVRMVHLNQKLYRCNWCEKTFTYWAKKVNHEKVHNR